MQPPLDSAGQVLYAPPRGPRSKTRAKTVYPGLIFQDLRRSAVRNLRSSGVAESVAMKITGHKTGSVFTRYAIVSPADLRAAGRKLSTFHGGEFGDK